MQPGINDKILCYLSEEANSAVATMVKLGLDQDLAISVLEQLWKEEDIYDIPSDHGHVS